MSAVSSTTGWRPGSGDVLGHDRLLPQTREGDVLLVANAGAYGRSMASGYNLRQPPEEIVPPG
jgi:diaminopimelate decarboxylase/aspartate kinase